MSATTVPVTAPAATARPRLLGRDVLTALLVAGPLCEVVEALLSPLAGTTTRADAGAIAAHQQQFVVSVLFGLLGTVVLLPAFLGIAQACVGRSPRFARAGAALTMLAMLGFAGERMSQAFELQLARTTSPARTASIVDGAMSTPIAIPLLVMFLVGAFLGLICLAVACWRAGLPKPAAVAVGVFQLVDLALPSELGTAISHLLLLGALSWIAVAIRRTDV